MYLRVSIECVAQLVDEACRNNFIIAEKNEKFGRIKRSGIRIHVANYFIPETIVSLILFAPAFIRVHVINDYG